MGCVGGRVVCVCELINLRCVCLSGCVLRVVRWDRVLGEGVFVWIFRGRMQRRGEQQRGEKTGKQKRESSHPQHRGYVFDEISFKEAIIIIGK